MHGLASCDDLLGQQELVQGLLAAAVLGGMIGLDPELGGIGIACGLGATGAGLFVLVALRRRACHRNVNWQDETAAR